MKIIILSCRVLPVWPTYYLLHFKQLSKYITPVVLQLKSPWILHFSPVTVDLTSFEGLMYEHNLQDLPHWCVLVFTLEGLALVANLALTNNERKFGGCLKASIGGLAKIFFMIGSWIRVFQCVLTVVDMLVRQGWYLTAKITLSDFTFTTFLRASDLVTLPAFWIAARTTFLL